MLTRSLAQLGKDLDVKVTKSYFPYKFAIESHLFYVGDTPPFKYYENSITIDEYKKIKTNT
jgi:hypothetical protein